MELCFSKHSLYWTFPSTQQLNQLGSDLLWTKPMVLNRGVTGQLCALDSGSAWSNTSYGAVSMGICQLWQQLFLPTPQRWCLVLLLWLPTAPAPQLNTNMTELLISSQDWQWMCCSCWLFMLKLRGSLSAFCQHLHDYLLGSEGRGQNLHGETTNRAI